MSLFKNKRSRDRWPFKTVREGLVWAWKQTPPAFKSFFQAPTPELREYVADLLRAGAIEGVSSLKFQGPLFSVPKKDSNKRRVILDLSALNQYIECPSFRMTTIKDVKNVLPLGSFACSIDLKDAYWHVPIHPVFRKYLGFRIGKQRFQFRALPFGLNIAPRVFTKLCKAVLKELRLKGIPVLVYLDDWLVWGVSEEVCQRNTKVVLEVLQARGFRVNWGKSRLIPSRTFPWLGIQWNTQEGQLSMPQEKVKSLRKDIVKFVRKSVTKDSG